MAKLPDIEPEEFDEHSLADQPDFDEDDGLLDDLEIEVEPDHE